MKEISQVVDLQRWPWVCPYEIREKTPWGLAGAMRGFLSDGASGIGIRDSCPMGFVCHDWQYETATAYPNGPVVTKWQADLMYGCIQFRYRDYFEAFIRPVGLTLFAWPTWRRYRELDITNPEHVHRRIIPYPEHWVFPSWRTEDAVWIGPLSSSLLPIP